MKIFVNKLRSFAFSFLFYMRHPGIMLRNLNTYKNTNFAHKNFIQSSPRISIIIVTYNAIDNIRLCLESLHRYKPMDADVIVVDNNSEDAVKNYLREAKNKGLIDQLELSSDNYYYVKGNNIGARLSRVTSKYLLLLNSDIEIKHTNWMDILLANAPEKGIISFGKTDIPVIRPDGWCFLIDRNLFMELGGLNEYYQMNWGITDLTGRAAKANYEIRSIINPADYIIHYGQQSHSFLKKGTAKFNNMDYREIVELFKKSSVQL